MNFDNQNDHRLISMGLVMSITYTASCRNCRWKRKALYVVALYSDNIYSINYFFNGRKMRKATQKAKFTILVITLVVVVVILLF